MNSKEEDLLQKLIEEKDLLKTLRDVRGELDVFLKMEYFLTWKYVIKETFDLIQQSESYKEYLNDKSKGEMVDPLEIEIYVERDREYLFLSGNINLADEEIAESFSTLLNDNFSKIQIESYISQNNFNFIFEEKLNFENFEKSILSEFCDKDYIKFLDKEKLSQDLSISNTKKKGMKI